MWFPFAECLGHVSLHISFQGLLAKGLARYLAQSGGAEVLGGLGTLACRAGCQFVLGWLGGRVVVCFCCCFAQLICAYLVYSSAARLIYNYTGH